MTKLGRNDVCHCGSGKKYKRCCLDKDAKANSLNLLLNQFNINDLDDLSIEEKEALYNAVTQALPKENIEELLSIPEEVMETWLGDNMASLQGMTISTPSDLSKSPVMMYLDTIIKTLIENNNTITLTDDGYLPPSIVKACSELFDSFEIIEQYGTPTFSDFKGPTQEDVRAVDYAFILGDLSGIFTLTDDKLILSPKYVRLYEQNGIQACFIPMLEAALYKYDWSYFDNIATLEEINIFWAFMVWRMSKHQNPKRLQLELIETWPALKKKINNVNNLSSDDLFADIIYFRFTTRFLLYFGFIKSNFADDSNERPSDICEEKLILTPIFHDTFSFDF